MAGSKGRLIGEQLAEAVVVWHRSIAERTAPDLRLGAIGAAEVILCSDDIALVARPPAVRRIVPVVVRLKQP